MKLCEVVLGSRAGDYYLVREGVTEGQIVVTNGNFKIDSALQIQADEYDRINHWKNLLHPNKKNT